MPITDQPSPGGWSNFYGVRVAKALAVGTVVLAAVFNIHGAINSKSVPGSSTGSILQVDGQTRRQEFPTTCSATGGLTNYSTCDSKLPISTSGALLGVTIECGNWAKAMTGDVSFKATAMSASGSPLTNLNNVTLGTGAYISSMFAQPVPWKPGLSHLTFTSLTAPTGTLNTTRYNCKIVPILSDIYGS